MVCMTSTSPVYSSSVPESVEYRSRRRGDCCCGMLPVLAKVGPQVLAAKPEEYRTPHMAHVGLTPPSWFVEPQWAQFHSGAALPQLLLALCGLVGSS